MFASESSKVDICRLYKFKLKLDVVAGPISQPQWVTVREFELSKHLACRTIGD